MFSIIVMTIDTGTTNQLSYENYSFVKMCARPRRGWMKRVMRESIYGRSCRQNEGKKMCVCVYISEGNLFILQIKRKLKSFSFLFTPYRFFGVASVGEELF